MRQLNLTSRRQVLTGIAAAGVSAAPLTASAARPAAAAAAVHTATLQAQIDAAAPLGRPVVLPPGTTVTGPLTLRPGSIITGVGPSTRLAFSGGGAVLSAEDAPGVRLHNFAIDGDWRRLDGPGRTAASGSVGLVTLTNCAGIEIDGLTISRVAGHGLVVSGSSGRIERCTISEVLDAAVFALDSRLAITGNTLEGCGNNGILVWRSSAAEDGSEVSGNRIAKIRADGGGQGQNGNGVNVFRAGGVRVQNNTITDCAYTAVRGNAASNILIAGNTCLRLGEVALYAEFGFEGALIANNVVDRAATGISVTNANEGGRLAVVQGNLIRNLFRREKEPVDTRGHGISIEADTIVSANTIESAPTAGILVGWGRYMRDVSITGNLIRASRSGVLISSDAAAIARVLVAHNLVTGATDGAIRAHDRGRVSGPDLAELPDVRGRVSIIGNTTGANNANGAGR